jgi:hypothetical protein
MAIDVQNAAICDSMLDLLRVWGLHYENSSPLLYKVLPSVNVFSKTITA